MVPEQICRCLVFDKCWAKCCCAGVKRSRIMEGTEGFFGFFFFYFFMDGSTDSRQTQQASVQTNTHLHKHPDGKSNAGRSCIAACFRCIYYDIILHDSCFTFLPHFPPRKPSRLHSNYSLCGWRCSPVFRLSLQQSSVSLRNCFYRIICLNHWCFAVRKY